MTDLNIFRLSFLAHIYILFEKRCVCKVHNNDMVKQIMSTNFDILLSVQTVEKRKSRLVTVN